METFYRVQDAEGIGPYQKFNNAEMFYRHGGDTRNHPSPYISGRHIMDDNELCGFRNMQQLYRWFGGYLPGLLRNGYKIVKVNGTLKYSDPYQVAYEPEGNNP